VTEAGSGALMPSEVAAVAAQPVLAAVDAGKTSLEDWQLWWLAPVRGVMRGALQKGRAEAVAR
jgi:hypothetical protein